jgi:hypothetical protein
VEGKARDRIAIEYSHQFPVIHADKQNSDLGAGFTVPPIPAIEPLDTVCFTAPFPLGKTRSPSAGYAHLMWSG